MGIVLKYRGQEFNHFSSGRISLKYASTASTFSLTGEFDGDNPLHKELFKPLGYQQVIINSVSGERLITGVILDSTFESKAEKTLVTFGGYSKTGVLGDCNIPVSQYPLEYNGLTLQQLAVKLCDPFGISVSVQNDQGRASEVIPEITAKQEITVSQFLTNIAAQRNLVITHDEFGQLVITKANTNISSTATYREEIPATRIALSVSGQGMHSQITTMKQADISNDNAAEATVTNSLVSAFRPKTRKQTNGNDNTSEDAANNVRSNELKSIKLSINSDRWEWKNSNKGNKIEVVRPNNIVDVISDDVYLPNRTRFFVDSTNLIFSPKASIAELKCVLPEVYNGNAPRIVFR